MKNKNEEEKNKILKKWLKIQEKNGDEEKI